MTTSADDRSRRVLILAPTGRDAEVTGSILKKAGIESTSVPDVGALCEEVERGVGAVIITAEALSPAAQIELRSVCERQPEWSELPVMIFVTSVPEMRATETFELPRAQLMLVDRPIHVRTLVSTAQAALRTRSRQYEIRDLLARLQDAIGNERRHGERLAGLAGASLSIASALSLPDVLRMITEQARKLVGADLAVTRVVSITDDLEKAITAVSHSETYKAWENFFSGQDISSDLITNLIQSPIRLTSRQGTPKVLDAIFEQSEVRPRVRGLLGAPLLERDGRTIGFIALSNKYEGDFTVEDEAVLLQLAQMASAAVQNARLYREAQDANRAKDDFLATLAHELRTPMTAILGWVQMLKEEGVGGQEAAPALQMIEASTRVQARLVEDLLDVSRIIAGKLKLAPEPVELGPLIESVASTFLAGAQEREVQIKTKTETDPLSVWGDPTRLQQIIWNLLSNAIKFTPAGGRVELNLRRSDGHALITVIDTGEGIAEDLLPHVFERFKQGETGTMRTYGGLGLGLAIVRHLVDLHHGTVEAMSAGAGKGAEFRVRLPLLVLRPEAPPPSEAPDLRGARVLVVDDDEFARAALSDVLRSIGVEARAVGSVKEAFDTLREFDPDLVISDIAMPGEDGYALVRRLRQFESDVGKEIPALALTGYGRPEDRMKILSSGFQRYVQKPVNPGDLAAIAAELIRA